jgi:F-type H+-transporting ATPase subunit O
VASDLVRPPLQLYSLEGRYAHALFSAASKTDALPSIEKEVGSLQALIAKDAGFASFLTSPIMSVADKSAVVRDVMGKAKYSDTITNLLVCMAENNALPKTEGILSAYGDLMSSHRNEVSCTITSAKALDKKSLDSVKKSLEGFAKGQVMNVSVAVDPSIMGGLVVEVGDKYIDMSTKTKIAKITKLLQETI